MSQQIVSIYTFELKKEATDKQLIEASAKLDDKLLGMAGFHYRSLTKTENGQWQDIVYWDSKEALLKADALENNQDFAQFMSLIEETSVRNSKAYLYSSVYPEMETVGESQAQTA